jgi:N-acetylneuraminic acid mutarotase
MTCYDLETEQVSELAHMPVGVPGASAAMGEDGRVYVVGGKNQTLAELYQYEVQIFDPETGSWSFGAGMPVPCTVSEAVSMPDGLIYVISGINETIDPLRPIGYVQIYDPAADTWAMGANMPEPRYSGATIGVSENVIMYIGGSNPDAGYTYSDIIHYSITDDYWWGSMSSFPEKFAGADAVMGPDGMIYLIGGGYGNAGTPPAHGSPTQLLHGPLPQRVRLYA